MSLTSAPVSWSGSYSQTIEYLIDTGERGQVAGRIHHLLPAKQSRGQALG